MVDNENLGCVRVSAGVVERGRGMADEWGQYRSIQVYASTLPVQLLVYRAVTVEDRFKH